MRQETCRGHSRSVLNTLWTTDDLLQTILALPSCGMYFCFRAYRLDLTFAGRIIMNEHRRGRLGCRANDNPEVDANAEDENHYKCAPTNKTTRYSRYAWYSFLAVNAAFTVVGCNAVGALVGINAIFSIVSLNSVLSVLSLNSILSVASTNCVLCYKCDGETLCIGD